MGIEERQTATETVQGNSHFRVALLIQADGVGGHVERHEREGHHGEPTHEDGDVHDSVVSQQFLGAPVHAMGSHARLGQCRGEFIDNLLPGIVEGRRQAGDQCPDLLRRKMALLLRDLLVLVIRVASQRLLIRFVTISISAFCSVDSV